MAVRRGGRAHGAEEGMAKNKDSCANTVHTDVTETVTGLLERGTLENIVGARLHVEAQCALLAECAFYGVFSSTSKHRDVPELAWSFL